MIGARGPEAPRLSLTALIESCPQGGAGFSSLSELVGVPSPISAFPGGRCQHL